VNGDGELLLVIAHLMGGLAVIGAIVSVAGLVLERRRARVRRTYVRPKPGDEQGEG
jgi:hypothetical protein